MGKHSSSSSSSDSDDDRKAWKKQQKKLKKLQKKGQLPPGVYPATGKYPGRGWQSGSSYPVGKIPPPHGAAPPMGMVPPPAGYPPAAGHSSAGYPPGPGYPPGSGYPPSGGAPPFTAPPAGAFAGVPPGNSNPPGYPPQAGYPPQQGYPPQAGYPPQQGYPSQAGYLPQQGHPPQPGYPSQPQYPGSVGMQSTPPGASPFQPPPAASYQPPGGYPGQNTPSGYSQSQAPPSLAAGSYPGQVPMTGYSQAPPSFAGGGYPGQAPPVAHPSPHSQAPPPPQPVQPHPVHTSGPAGMPPAAGGDAHLQQAMHNMSQLSVQEHARRGTVQPVHPFSAEADCEVLRKAMKGAGTDERAIIDIVSHRSNVQRQEIKKMFKTMYGKDLIKDLASELSGNFEETVMALFVPTTYYDAWSLNRAMKGIGTKESVLIEILCTRTNAEIREIVASYKQHFRQDLEKDIIGDTSGHFKRLLVSCCQANRDESSVVDHERAKKEAAELFNAGEKKWGTDESTFNRILAIRSIPQLRATFGEYVKLSQRDILNSIDREMSGDLKEGFKALVWSIRHRPQYFADKLWAAMKGAGTDDSTLIRIVVSRSEVDLVNIKQAFLASYHKTLYQMIEGDTSGDYKRILQGIVGPN